MLSGVGSEMHVKWRWIWCAGVALALAADMLPWSNFVGHAHWQKVVWIPFTEAHVSKLDALSNILLFVPFGFLYRFPRRGEFPPDFARVLAIAAATGGTGEWFQVFCHNRFSSATDVVNNVAGAALGAAMALAVQMMMVDGPAACGRRLP